MSGAAARLAWLVWSLTVVCTFGLVMLHEKGSLIVILPVAAWVVTSSTVGALIVSRRPENPIGWILCAIGFLSAFGGFSGAYAIYTLITHPGALPAGEVAAWFSAWVQIATPALPLFVYLFLLFPDGRPQSRRWRPLLWFNGLLITITIVYNAFAPGPILGETIRNPLGIEAAAGISAVVAQLIDLFTALLLVVSVVSVYLRFRRAGGIERQQIKWLAYAAALLGVVAIVGTLGELLLGLGWWIFLILVATLFGIPLSIGAAVLRYRLYDIDILINRTLVYGPLTAMLVLVYLGGVVALQAALRVLSGQDSTLTIVASTLVIAALFSPLRRRVQAFVDRRFYRRKYDAAKTLAAFNARLRDETDLDTLGRDLMGVARDAIQPEHVSLWLRSDTASRSQQTD